MNAEWNACDCGVLVRAPATKCERCRHQPAIKAACPLRRNYNTKGDDAVPGYRSDCTD